MKDIGMRCTVYEKERREEIKGRIIHVNNVFFSNVKC